MADANYRRQLLLEAGLDPSQVALDDQGFVITAPEPPQSPVVNQATSLQPLTPKPLGSATRQFGAGVLPAAGGLLAGSLAAAPFTGGGSLLLPLAAGITGAIAGGYGTAKLQEKVMPESWNQQLALDAEVNPKASAAGNIASSLVFMKPDFKSVANAAQGLRNVATGGASRLSAAQGGNLLNIGLGGGLGAAASAYEDVSRDKDIDLGKLAISAIGNALINNPNKLGQKLGATPNIYDDIGETQARQMMQADQTTLGEESLQARQSAERARVAAEQEVQKTLVESLPAKFQKKIKDGDMSLQDAIIVAREEEGIAQRKAQAAAGKLQTPSTLEDIRGFGAQERGYEEMYSQYGRDVLSQEPTPKLKLAETQRVVENQLAEKANEVELQKFVTESKKLDFEKARLEKEAQDLEEAQRVASAPKPASENALKYLESGIVNRRLAGEEVRPTVSESDLLPSRAAMSEDADLLAPQTEAERIQEEFDLGKRKQDAESTVLSDEQRRVIQEAKAEVTKKAADVGVTLEPTVGFRDAMQLLAQKRGVKLEMDSSIEGAGETVSVAEQKRLRNLLQDVSSKINPEKAGMDTWPHELFHPFVTDMEIGKSQIGRDLAKKAKEVFGGSEEVLTDVTGKEVITRLLNLDKEGKTKKFFKDFWSFVKTKYGNPTTADVKRLMANRLLNEVSYSELNPSDVAGKVGVESTQEEPTGEPALTQGEGQQLPKEGDTVSVITRVKSQIGEAELRNRAKLLVDELTPEQKASIESGPRPVEALAMETAARLTDNNRWDSYVTSKNRGQDAVNALNENVTPEVAKKKFADLKKEVGLEEGKNKVSEKDLKAAKFAGRQQEGDAALKDDRTFATDFEKQFKSVSTPYNLRPNKEGKFTSSEVAQALSKINPGEAQLLKDAGIEAYLKTNPKVSAEELAKWVKENGPKVEVVEYGQSGKVTPEKEALAKMKHEWEDNLEQYEKSILDRYVGTSSRGETFEEWRKKHSVRHTVEGFSENATEFQDLYFKAKSQPFDTSPRATSAYNYVSPKDPKKFPVQRVDVVLPQKRMPESQFDYGDTKNSNYRIQGDEAIERAKWEPDNLHENVPNTLGWAAIQYETLPSGEKVAHIFELQSRWGQEVRNLKGEIAEKQKILDEEGLEEGSIYGKNQINRKERLKTLENPLLKDYNRLILKAAIDEARKRGATKIAISDAETAMLTEGHDAHANVVGPEGDILGPVEGNRSIANEIIKNGGEYKGFKIQPPQEKGMRFNYDESLPRIAEELTGSKGESVEFGEHKNAFKPESHRVDETNNEALNRAKVARSNLIFKNADGTPKTSITARLYDIGLTSMRRASGEPFSMFGKRYQESGDALPRQQASGQQSLSSEPTSRQEVKDVVAKEQPLKLAFLDFMLGQSDKVKKVDSELGDAFEKFFLRRSYLEGKYANTIQDVAVKYKPEVRDRVSKYMMALDADKPAPYTLKGEEVALHKEIQNYLKNVRADQNELGILVSGTREGKFNENYFPNMMGRDVVNTLVNKGNSQEAATYRKLWRDHITTASQGKVTSKEANEIINNYIRAIGSKKLSGQMEFGAVRKAEGYGLPPEMQEKDLLARLTRYGKRVAKDFAYFQELQSKENIAAKLGLHDQKGKLITKEGVESAKSSNEEVIKAIKMVDDDYDYYHPVTNAFNRLVTNSLLGPLSGARDIATIPVNVIPYINKLEDFGAFVKAIPKLGQAWKKSLQAGARRENLDSLLYGDSGNSGNYVVDKMNQVAQGLRVVQGREFLEQGARAYSYAIGEELTKANILRAAAGDKSSVEWLRKFGKIVDGNEMKSAKDFRSLSQEDVMKITKSFVDQVQGSYDGRNLPLGIMEGPAAPFFALSRWSVEKANVIRKDVLEPLGRGNVKPFLMYSLGAVLTGAVVEKLAEEVNNRRAADPTLNEAFKNSQADTDDQVGWAIKALQLGSFAGILSDVVKGGWDLKQGKIPQGFTYPAADFIANTLGQNLSDALAAIKEGEDVSKTLSLFVEQVAKNSLQGYRLVNNNFLNEEDTKRSEKFRDKAVFETMTGQKQPTSFGAARSNPFMDTDYKEFKRAGTPEEAIAALKPAIDAAIRKSEGSPEKLKMELESLKRNSFQTMPNPENMPREFLNYVLFLRETQGEEVAAERIQEYLRMNMLNKMKSKAIPSV